MNYDASEYPPFAVTVDLVIFRFCDEELQVLLVKRAEEPYQGYWALPGGFVQIDEDSENAAHRELEEETGLSNFSLEQLKTYSTPDRDPRMRVVSVAYMAVTNEIKDAVAGSDAAEAQWVSTQEIPSLAFDHYTILTDALNRLQAKMEYSSFGLNLLPEQFTMPELRRLYEVTWGKPIDPANFRRKVLDSEGLLNPLGVRSSGVGRPSVVYQAGVSNAITPPFTR